jgi:hypothetical protein
MYVCKNEKSGIFFLLAAVAFYPLHVTFHTIPYKMSHRSLILRFLSLLIFDFIFFRFNDLINKLSLSKILYILLSVFFLYHLIFICLWEIETSVKY